VVQEGVVVVVVVAVMVVVSNYNHSIMHESCHRHFSDLPNTSIVHDTAAIMDGQVMQTQ